MWKKWIFVSVASILLLVMFIIQIFGKTWTLEFEIEHNNEKKVKLCEILFKILFNVISLGPLGKKVFWSVCDFTEPKRAVSPLLEGQV